MDFADVIRTTGAARAFTKESVADEQIYQVLESARFAPSGGNRQGWRVIVVKDQALRDHIQQLVTLVWRQYAAQRSAGETPFAATGIPSEVDLEAAMQVAAPAAFVDEFAQVPVMLVVCVDLAAVSAMDKDLDRVGIIGGASVYPFAQNVLLAARNMGLGGVLTTFLAHQEPAARKILNLPEQVAIAATIAIGNVDRHYTKLTRHRVEEFATIDRLDGEEFGLGSVPEEQL